MFQELPLHTLLPIDAFLLLYYFSDLKLASMLHCLVGTCSVAVYVFYTMQLATVVYLWYFSNLVCNFILF